MIQTKKREKFSEILYTVSLVILLVALFLKSTLFIPTWFNFGLVYKVMQMASIMVIIKIFLIDRREWRYQFAIVILVGTLFFLGYFSKNYDVFYYSLFIVGAQKIDFAKILKFFLQVNCILILLTVISAIFRVIPVQVQGRVGHPGLIRYSMGFLTPTDFAARIFYIMLAYGVWKNFRLKKAEYIIGFLILTILYYITNARLDGILLILLLITALLYPKIEKAIMRTKYIPLFILSFIFIFANLAIAYFYTPTIKILSKIDFLLSGRLHYGRQALREHGVSFLGQFVTEHGSRTMESKPFDYFYVDSSYIRLVTMLGIIVFILYLLALFMLYRRSYLNAVPVLVVYTLFVLLSSAIDQHLLDASYNIVLLAVFSNIDNMKYSRDIVV